MLARVWNFLAGGFLVGFVTYFFVSMLTTEPQYWTFLVGWLLLGGIIASTETPWSNTWAFMAIASFGLPLLMFASSVLISTDDPSAYSSGAATLGSATGGLLVGGIGAFFGFFLGLIFIVLAFATRRSNREKR